MWSIARQTFIRNSRFRKDLLFHIGLNILFMTMLGYLLQSAMNPSYKIPKVKVYYMDEGNQETSSLLNDIKSFSKEVSADFERIDTITKGKRFVRERENTLLLVLKNNEFIVYQNDFYPVANSVVNSLLQQTKNRYNAIYEVKELNEKAAIDKSESGVTIEELSKNQSTSSFEYYAVTQLTAAVLYFVYWVSAQVSSERKSLLYQRLRITGITFLSYILGKLLGYYGIIISTIFVMFLYGKYVLGANYGTNYIALFSIITTLIFSVIALGLLIGSFSTNSNKATQIVGGLFLPVLIFLGGGYTPFNDRIGGVFGILTNISPLRWANRSIFQMIFLKDYSLFWISNTINVVIASGLLFFLYRYLKREGDAL